MDNFELWLKGCKENGTKIYKMPENGLYKTWNERMVNYNIVRDTPVYHVWKKGKRIYCGLSYLVAVRKAEGE
jgi:hypothetical protein